MVEEKEVVPVVVCCTAARKQKGDVCRKRFECQKFKNFLNKAATAALKNVDMDMYYKLNYQFVPGTPKTDCANFEAKAL
jgi:hypothetical protein